MTDPVHQPNGRAIALGTHRVLAAGVAAVAVAGFAALGGAAALGAHPWWAEGVGRIGAVAGLALWAATWLAGMRRRIAMALFGGALLAASAMAALGKMRFVAAFAEDAAAGRMWYLGWIALLASATGLLAWALGPRKRGFR